MINLTNPLLRCCVCALICDAVELWWVLRTPSEYTVLKRKGFAVSSPECTFDSANNKYFPYAKVNDDGTFQL
jgi:hypothetical protein